MKNKRQDKDAKATGKADTDAAEPGAEINRQQDNNQFCTNTYMPSLFFNKLILNCCILVKPKSKKGMSSLTCL
ncbi:hypothetical protein ACNPHY_22555 [Klebsiella pneumoniae]